MLSPFRFKQWVAYRPRRAIACPSYGAPLVVIGAPLAIDADSFSRGAGNVEEVLRKICEAVHGFGDVKVKNER